MCHAWSAEKKNKKKRASEGHGRSFGSWPWQKQLSVPVTIVAVITITITKMKTGHYSQRKFKKIIIFDFRKPALIIYQILKKNVLK